MKYKNNLLELIFVIALFLKNTGRCLYINLIIVSLLTV